jgi:hypothetical protein
VELAKSISRIGSEKYRICYGRIGKERKGKEREGRGK